MTTTDLVGTLSSPGHFTVFAPTDAAFAKLTPAILNYLLANADSLKSVLLYHVVPGVKDLRFQFDPRDLQAVNGQEVYAEREQDRLFVNNAARPSWPRGRSIRSNVHRSTEMLRRSNGAATTTELRFEFWLRRMSRMSVAHSSGPSGRKCGSSTCASVRAPIYASCRASSEGVSRALSRATNTTFAHAEERTQ